MARVDEDDVLREMTHDDIAGVLEIQEPGAVLALADVFPQDKYPFPREWLGERWRQEVEDPEVRCFVVLHADVVSGFVAMRGDEFFHFGIAVEHWGSGLATRAHDAALARIADAGFRRAWADVYSGNRRARRFYEKQGWSATGHRSRGPVPPHAELLRYGRDLGRTGDPGGPAGGSGSVRAGE